ncbi:MAG: helix-turn-helix domain-containing protein, partial [Parasutterella excrementihominis]
EYLSAQTPAFRKKVKAEFRQMSLQCAVSRLRYEQNLTQQEVARKLQLSQSAVSKIERNALDVKLSDLVRYVNILGESSRCKLIFLQEKRSSFHWQILSIPTIAKKPDSVPYETTRVTKNRLAAAF